LHEQNRILILQSITLRWLCERVTPETGEKRI